MGPRRIALTIAVLVPLAWSVSAFALTSTPNDPLFEHCSDPHCQDEQWNLMSDGRGISANSVWPFDTGQGTVIAIIDTGIDFKHEDLAANISHNPGEAANCSDGIDNDHNGYVDDCNGWDFYGNDNNPDDDPHYGHGTGRAGIAAAVTDNAKGIAGVAPDAQIMVLRTSDTILHNGTLVARAIRYAVDNGANVIEMALGSVGTPAVLRSAVNYAQQHNVVMVAAMANEFSQHPNSPTFLDPVIGVGAIVPDTTPISGDYLVKGGFSNYGPILDVVAPSDVYATQYGGGYGISGGTSSATPEVAGVAALVISRAKALGIALSSEEVTQIIRMSADDLTGNHPTHPAKGTAQYHYAAGWDQYTGWGRVDAEKAVAMVTADGSKIPPVADINAPDWYRRASRMLTVKGLLSARAGNGPYSWTLSVGAGVQPSTWMQIGGGAIEASPIDGTLATLPTTGMANGLWTLDLKITDAQGNKGEDRQAFVEEHDHSLLAAFPKNLGCSVEAGPKFADLNGDGKQELIVADSCGRVHAITATGKELPGWPVLQDVDAAGDRLGFVGSPAVADLNHDGHPDVIEGGLDGKVYAWEPSGKAVPGWPVETKTPEGPVNGTYWTSGVFSSPAVGELDGRSADGPEVVVGGADGKVYAFHANGTPLAGWPVLLQDPGQSAQTAPIASSPAIGDIDGDHKNEVVIGDGEVYGSTARVYALRANGTFEPGWPVTLEGVAPSGTPVVAQGVSESPVLADVNRDGKMEIAISGFTTRFHLLRGNGTEMPGGAGGSGQFFSNVFGSAKDPNITTRDARATVGNLAFGDLNGDGVPDLVSPSTDARLFGASIHNGQDVPVQHLISAWNAKTGAYLPAFPRLVEDWMFLTAPIVADVNGDGKPEVVIGNGDGYIHAFSHNGKEPPGWPKYVGQWVQASAAAGDINGDHKVDIAVATRSGYVYVFSTTGLRSGMDWPSMRGNLANTGVFVP